MLFAPVKVHRDRLHYLRLQLLLILILISPMQRRRHPIRPDRRIPMRWNKHVGIRRSGVHNKEKHALTPIIGHLYQRGYNTTA